MVCQFFSHVFSIVGLCVARRGEAKLSVWIAECHPSLVATPLVGEFERVGSLFDLLLYYLIIIKNFAG